jgi:hypothetical protein
MGIGVMEITKRSGISDNPGMLLSSQTYHILLSSITGM